MRKIILVGVLLFVGGCAGEFANQVQQAAQDTMNQQQALQQQLQNQ